jgi:hypothetical protein
MTTMALQVRNDARLAGRVLRYHTWPHIKEQSVAEHSWQLLRILLCIWPTVPAHIMSYVVRHDCGEIKTGDAPYPVKAENKDIAIGMNRVEEQSLDEQVATGFLVLGPDVNDDEKWVVKLAEFIEMWEWGAEELLMGNQFARLVMQRCATVAKDRIGSALNLSPEDNVMFRAATLASEYMQKRKTIWEL